MNKTIAQALTLSALLTASAQVWAVSPEQLAADIETMKAEQVEIHCHTYASAPVCLSAVGRIVAHHHVQQHKDYYVALAYSRVPEDTPRRNRYGRAFAEIKSITRSIAQTFEKTGELPVVPK